MSMWTIVKETLAILGCEDIESLPEREQALIGECCYHCVPAKAIADMIRELRRELGGVVTAPASDSVSISIPLIEESIGADRQSGLSRFAERLAARRSAMEEEERGSGGRKLVPAA